MYRLLVVLVVLAVLAAPAGADQIIIQSSAPAIEVVDGDPLWKPSVAQISSWVSDGISGAAGYQALPSLSGVSRWIWRSPNGLPISGNGRVHLIIACTPELVATVAGWEAAWHPETWERIQADQAGVAAEIARRAKGQFSGRDILFVVGVRGVPATGPKGAIWYRGLWRHLSFSGQVPITTVATTAAPTSGCRPAWAGAYVLGQCGASVAGEATPYLSITRATILSRPRLTADPRITSQASAPGRGGRMVLTAGGGVGFVDLDL